jgi:hypothetical protein
MHPNRREGYTSVTGLTKDDKGVWRGSAMRGGKQIETFSVAEELGAAFLCADLGLARGDASRPFRLYRNARAKLDERNNSLTSAFCQLRAFQSL